MKKLTAALLGAIFLLSSMNPSRILSNEKSEASIEQSNPFEFTLRAYAKDDSEQAINEQIASNVDLGKDQRSALQKLQDQFIQLMETEVAKKQENITPGMACVEKVTLPADAKVIMHGDLHGNFQSLKTILTKAITDGLITTDLKLVGNTFFFCLGDYTDRGASGLEVWVLLMQLKLKNPDKVFLLKGNHEDITIAKRRGFLDKTTFSDELRAKFELTNNEAMLNKLLASWNKCFNMLPEMIVLDWENEDHTHTYLPCIHGAIESAECIQSDTEAKKTFERNCAKINEMLQDNSKKQAWINLQYKPYFDPYAWEKTGKSPYTWHDITEENAKSTITGNRGGSTKILGSEDIKTFIQKAFPEKSFVPAFLKGHRQNNRALFANTAHPGIAKLVGGLAWILDYQEETVGAIDTWVIIQKSINTQKPFSAELIRFPLKAATPLKKTPAHSNSTKSKLFAQTTNLRIQKKKTNLYAWL
ncbi:TPA: hypothetical protein DCW54_03565 [Candidatus Dependentiae bacterium]|nr:hypothetical protein [Candidatus Dependentiae bacterium]